jgi:hypothetical protein
LLAVELPSLRCQILRERTGRLKAPLAALAAVAALTRPATLQRLPHLRERRRNVIALQTTPAELDRRPHGVIQRSDLAVSKGRHTGVPRAPSALKATRFP